MAKLAGGFLGVGIPFFLGGCIEVWSLEAFSKVSITAITLGGAAIIIGALLIRAMIKEGEYISPYYPPSPPERRKGRD